MVLPPKAKNYSMKSKGVIKTSITFFIIVQCDEWQTKSILKWKKVTTRGYVDENVMRAMSPITLFGKPNMLSWL